MSTKRFYDIKDLEKKYGPMTVGLFLRSFRESDELSQTDYAKRLRISRANLCDIEKGRKLVSPERAAKIAKILGVPQEVLVQLAIQDELRQARLDYHVELRKAV
jgi:transcriptional regulator with XRE-family HTH domain